MAAKPLISRPFGPYSSKDGGGSTWTRMDIESWQPHNGVGLRLSAPPAFLVSD
jgi:hypothetical protein